MAEKRWTQNQKDAIEARQGSVLVSAAAGSGKTAVLVERVIQRITDTQNPTDADRLLVVTFTRAAAAEMKERISNKLTELVRQDPFNGHLRRQQLLLPTANISTIHSFCNEIIKEHFFTCDISPNFRVAEETELNILKQDALNHVLDKLYAEKDEGFLHFTTLFTTGKSDYNLTFTVLKLYEFLCSHPFAEKWLQEKEQMYDFEGDVSDTQWGKVLFSYAADAVDFCLNLCNQSLALLHEVPELMDKLFDLISNDYTFLHDFHKDLPQKTWDNMGQTIQNFNFTARFPTIKGFTKDPTKLQIQSNRNVIKKTLQTMAAYFSASEKDCREEIYALSPIVRQLFKTVRLFAAEYSALKKEKNWVDFNDLEHMALSVLVKEEENGFTITKEAEEIAKRFDEVMVDEYQDANEVQDLIFQTVSTQGEKLFVVGDVKQSIYGFRQAMPEIFLRRKESYPIYHREENNYPCKIILDKNFRSRRGVTDAVNFVFKHLLSTEVGDMEYTEEEQLVTGASYPPMDTPDVSFHLLERGIGEEKDMDILEARHIAKMIKELVGTYQVTEGDTTRPATFSDCAILLRNANTHAGTFVRELKELEVPAVSDVSDSFLQANEVAVMLSLLRIIDNPLQDIPLLTVLMSPIYGFTPDDMAEIRLHTPKEKLYTAVKNHEKLGNEKAKAFFAELNTYRIFAAANPTDKLIGAIYSQTGYMDIVSAAAGGTVAVNNLRLLQEYAKSYENNGYKGLCGFIRFINRLEEQECDLPAAGNKDTDVNAVTVMSIHRSKGLEFPICFVATLARKFNSDKRDEVLLHGGLGLGLRHKHPGSMTRQNTMPRNAVSLELDRESKSEELRVLYVAMTRAQEKLYLVSSPQHYQKHLQDIGATLTGEDKLSPYIVRSASSMSNWITACALLHPSGQELRSIAQTAVIPCADNTSLWDIQVVPYQEASKEPIQQEKAAVEKPQAQEAAPTMLDAFNREEQTKGTLHLEELEKRFAYIYPFEQAANLPAKVSVSDIAHEKGKEEKLILSHPSYLLHEALSPAQKGTALHTFMQYANFHHTLQNPQKEKERLVKQGFLSQAEADAVNMKKVLACLNHPLMQRCLQAETVFREYRFTIKIDASVLEKDSSIDAIGEEMIMQGAVDCAFVENDEIVIVDYKTDKVKDMNKLRQLYGKQLALYKLAMEQSTGKKVKHCFIFSLMQEEIIEV